MRANLEKQPLHGRLCRCDGVTRLQPCKHLHPARARVVDAHPVPLRRDDGLHLQGYTNLRRARWIESGEAGGRDADDGHRVIVDEDLFADHGRVAIEATSPVVVPEHDHRMPFIDAVVFF